ncbi:MAG: transcriptional regulator, partial [Aldersonia sp.]|nr:transcriptional regulator [Aldersonia sp.]
LKEPSSEMIAAVAGALGIGLGGLLGGIADELNQRSLPIRRPVGPVLMAA